MPGVAGFEERSKERPCGTAWGNWHLIAALGLGVGQIMLEKVKTTGVVILAGLLFIATVVFGFLMVVDGEYWNPPVVYETKYLNTDKTEYAPGDVVSVFLDVYKGRNIEGCVTWSLVNGRVFPYAKRKLGSPEGTYEKWYALTNEKLPTANLTDGGQYHFEALVEYRVNPLRTVTYKLKTTPFRIIQPAKDTP